MPPTTISQLNTPIDILIPLGQGSRHQDIELRYCLRSIEKHLKGVGNVWLVGECPEWVNRDQVVHVPVEDDPSNTRRAWNIYRKIMAGIKYRGLLHIDELREVSLTANGFGAGYTIAGMVANDPLSDTFLFMNDDHYLLQDYVAADFPYYHRGRIDLAMMAHRLPQYTQYQNTLRHLPEQYRLDFGVHCPMLISGAIFQSFANCYLPPIWPTHGFEIKSLYGNWLNQDVVMVELDDLKFSAPAFPETIHRVLEGRPWFSVGDATLKSGGMRQVLQELYPWPSRYEKQEGVPKGWEGVSKAN